MACTVDNPGPNIADKNISWHFSGLLLGIIMLVLSCCEENELTVDVVQVQVQQQEVKMMMKPCDEIYLVPEGETLQTIGEKCGDPFIAEYNPHIHDPDDVFPGLLTKITSFNRRQP